MIDGIIFMGLVGSHAHGLARPDSDEDWRGIFCATPRELLGLDGYRQEIDLSREPKEDKVAWELGKFVRLALRGNPSVLEVLWSPRVELPNDIDAQDLANALIAGRQRFLSKACHRTFYGYARQQIDKSHKGGDAKYWVHALRLLLTGLHLMQEGDLRVQLPEEDLALVREARFNPIAIEKLESHLSKTDLLYRSLEPASALPDYPDTAWAHDLVYDYRARQVGKVL